MEPWFLGIDLGTGSCKSVVINEKAEILGFGSAEYAGLTVQNKWNEQDPESILTGLIKSVRISIEKAGVNPHACQALSIGGALHSLIAIDHSAKPLTGVITWADGRGSPQAQVIRQTPQAADLYQHSGCPVHGMYPFYKILWLRDKKSDVYSQAARYITAKEYVFEQITGQRTVDYSLASGSGLFNVQTLGWDSLSLELAGVKPNQLSQPAAPSTIFRGITLNMAEAMEIPSDVLVVLGSSDAANSNFGAGATQSWQATCMVGTSGAFRIITPKPLLDPAARTWCYAIDETHWLVGGAINNGGIAFSWLKDTLNQANAQFGIEKQVSFDELIALAAQAKPGAGGVLCLPYFTGERSPYWNLNARATFFGMTLNHDLRHLARALLEGVAFRLRSLSEILSEISGDIQEVRASGGFTHSTLWPQIIASTLGRELLLPAWGETSVLGAAFWAMLGAGALSALDQANDLVSIQAKYNPVLEETKVYDRLYPIYSGIYQSLCIYFDQIAQFQD